MNLHIYPIFNSNNKINLKKNNFEFQYRIKTAIINYSKND